MNIFPYPTRWICWNIKWLWALEFNSCSLLFCWGKHVACIQIYFVGTSFVISLLEQWLKFSLSFHQYAFIPFSCVTSLFHFICDHCKCSAWKATLTIRELKPYVCRNLHYASLLKIYTLPLLGDYKITRLGQSAFIFWHSLITILIYIFLYYCSTEF